MCFLVLRLLLPSRTWYYYRTRCRFLIHIKLINGAQKIGSVIILWQSHAIPFELRILFSHRNTFMQIHIYARAWVAPQIFLSWIMFRKRRFSVQWMEWVQSAHPNASAKMSNCQCEKSVASIEAITISRQYWRLSLKRGFFLNAPRKVLCIDLIRFLFMAPQC